MEKNSKTKEAGAGKHFFFPKERPPVTIVADSLEEAEQKLKKIKNKKNE